MNPTISNAFNDESAEPTEPRAPGRGGSAQPPNPWKSRRSGEPSSPSPRSPRKSLAASLAAMQVDLSETEFGCSLELSPMTAIDALAAVAVASQGRPGAAFLLSMEQSAWRDGSREMSIAEIAQRLSIPVVEQFSDDLLVLEDHALRQLVSLCQPTRLLVTAVEGPIDRRDAEAMNAAIDAGRSPLLAELRATAALEVLGDRAVVLHCRDKAVALTVVAQNFRHYLAALQNRPTANYAAPEPWQIERLLSLTGVLTVRPIETQLFSTSIDVGVNTARERFGQPADRSLIYDVPSNTWHDEP